MGPEARDKDAETSEAFRGDVERDPVHRGTDDDTKPAGFTVGGKRRPVVHRVDDVSGYGVPLARHRRLNAESLGIGRSSEDEDGFS